MTKKTASKRAKAKGAPLEPTKPRKSKAPGEGVTDAGPVNGDVMDLAGEKNSAMPSTETVEERIERLRQELPEGYDIFCTDGMISFGDDDLEPEAPVEPIEVVEPEPQKPKPYWGRHVLFDSPHRYGEARSKAPTADFVLAPMFANPFFPKTDLNLKTAVGKRLNSR